MQRELPGRYMCLPPRANRFSRHTYGKPSLTISKGDSNIQFDVSHCDDDLLVAVAHAHSVSYVGMNETC